MGEINLGEKIKGLFIETPGTVKQDGVISYNLGKGGDAGEVFIAARKIVGSGKITADGGDGSTGGKGGKVTLICESNQFDGEISAKGGKPFIFQSLWYQTWWGMLILGIVASAVVALTFYFL